MLRKYSYIYCIIIMVAGSLEAEGVGIPSAHHLMEILQKNCNGKKCLIQRVDNKTHYLEKIMDIQKAIHDLENQRGIAQFHKEQATLVDSLCKGDSQPEWCALFEQFQNNDQKRTDLCKTVKCQLMRLYNQLHTYKVKLAELLRPYHKELHSLNEQIHYAHDQLIKVHSIESEIFNIYPNMLFL